MAVRFCLPILAVFVFVAGPVCRADHSEKGKPVTLLGETGRHHHPIATKDPEAQKFFDQGLTLHFGFNHPEAVRSFRKAAELDPQSPMPYWGVALSLGPNYNREIDPVDAARNKAAYEAVQKGLALAANGPAHELAYVKALAKRYSVDPKADSKQLEVDYKDAMKELVQTYPDDLDAATLYAEALMNLRPWKLWGRDGQPAEETPEIVRLLESVMARYPAHCGANHYYIHTMEASPNPERALASALRLLDLVPWAGHLVHMPGHIFIHTGNYDLVALANEKAIAADEAFFKQAGTAGVYRMMYYHHNIHFLAVGRMAQGRFAEAKKAADKLAGEVGPQLKHMPMLEAFVQVPLQVLLRFHRWDDVLQVPEPQTKLALSRAFRHYGRAVALVGKGKRDEAEKERRAFEELRKQFPADAQYMTNPVEKVFGVAAAVLDARLAADPETALGHWRRAVELEDALVYGEPPDWYYPVRESLGAALLRSGKPQEAERVFREDLKRNRRNGRSLFGLMESLKAQKKTADAEWVRLEFERAWKQAPALRIEDY